MTLDFALGGGLPKGRIVEVLLFSVFALAFPSKALIGRGFRRDRSNCYWLRLNFTIRNGILKLFLLKIKMNMIFLKF